MNIKKLDRRVHRTRRLLKEALYALILEKGYDAVTIEALTSRADLGRTTFYLHYKDKEDLLLESIRELIDDLTHKILQSPHSSWQIGEEVQARQPVLPIMLTFQHAAVHANLYRIILRGEGSFYAHQRLRGIITQAVEEILRVLSAQEHLELDPQVPVEVFTSFVAGAWIGNITWWLENEMPYPAEEAAIWFQKLFLRGAQAALRVRES
jgi:AcrR family transcriptional regulator